MQHTTINTRRFIHQTIVSRTIAKRSGRPELSSNFFSHSLLRLARQVCGRVESETIPGVHSNLVADISISYIPRVKIDERPQVHSSKEGYELFLNSWDMGAIDLAEHFKVMLLNAKGRVMGIYRHTTGGNANVLIDAKLIFLVAIETLASSIILCHNHPSGDVRPSGQDLAKTTIIKDAGKLFNIRVDDHLIISSDRYFSMADEGLMP